MQRCGSSVGSGTRYVNVHVCSTFPHSFNVESWVCDVRPSACCVIVAMSEVAHTGGACTGHLYRTTYSKMHDGLQAFLLQPQEPSFNVNTTAPVDEYQLMFRTEKDTVVETGDRTLNSTTTELSLTGLKMGAVYTITVVAINTAGT